MKKMKNCRTCKHADIHILPSGRRSFQYAADCTVPIDISMLPYSAWQAIRLIEENNMPRRRACLDDIPIICSRWEKIEK